MGILFNHIINFVVIGCSAETHSTVSIVIRGCEQNTTTAKEILNCDMKTMTTTLRVDDDDQSTHFIIN